MYLKKHIKHTIHSPHCALRAIKLVYFNHCPDMNARQLAQIIRQRFSSTGNIPSPVSLIDIEGEQYYLRLYGLANLEQAARHLWAAHNAPFFGISTPGIKQTCFTRIMGKSVYAILEHKVPGSEIGEKPWPHDLSINLAVDLARWHGITKACYDPYLCLMIERHQGDYLQHFNRLLELDGDHSSVHSEILESARQILSDHLLFNELCMSHGDISANNLVIRDDFKIIWIDTDMISIRPVWHDLSTVMCKFANQISAEAINIFERKYFEETALNNESWLVVRNRWLFLRNVLEALKWKTIHLRPWIKVHNTENSGPTQWAHRFFEQAYIVMDHMDSSMDTGSLVGKMYNANNQETE